MSELVPGAVLSTRLVPAADAGDRAAARYVEFFTAQIRNPNTRIACARAASAFFAWCEQRGLALPAIQPVHVATYVEQIGRERSASTVKQQIAAIRMLFDWLVVGQAVPHNPPASAVRGPKHSASRGKTRMPRVRRPRRCWRASRPTAWWGCATER